MGGDKVADEDEDGHDDVLGNRNNVGPRDLGDGDAAVGLVGSVEVDVVGADAGRDGQLELLGLGQPLSRQVARVEGGGDDDLGVDELLVKGRVLVILVRRRHQRVAGVLEPFPDPELVLDGAKKFGNLSIFPKSPNDGAGKPLAIFIFSLPRPFP